MNRSKLSVDVHDHNGSLLSRSRHRGLALPPWAVLLLALSGLARSAAAQTYPINFDARALGASYFNVNYGAALATGLVQTIELAPGNYTFHAPPSAPSLVEFSVISGSGETGALVFDSHAYPYVSASGTTLTVTGWPLTVDATTLSTQNWGLTGGAVVRSTSAVSTVGLLPAEYRFEIPAGHPGMTFNFTMRPNGTIELDPSHDTYASASGTTLTVTGLPLTVDATALSHPLFNILFGEAGNGVSSQVTTLRLLPSTPSTGKYPLTFHSPRSSQTYVPFTLSTSGHVEYDASHDQYVSGRGTDTLIISGFPITIDATAVPVADFNIAYEIGGTNDVARTFRQIPGLYDLHLPSSSSNVLWYTVVGPDTVTGTVTDPGKIDYNPAFDLCVQGRGTTVLTVLCNPAPLQLIADFSTYISTGVPASALKNSNAQLAKVLVNKIAAVLSKVEAAQDATDPGIRDQLLQEALDKIHHDILAKTNGCGAAGAPDSNDWIIDCAIQAEVTEQLNQILAAITALM